MTTSVTYESALLADAIMKAARVAPSKGAAFDKAAGIVFDVSPTATVIMATDLDVTYRQVVHHTAASGDTTGPITWRLPSQLVAGVMATLPLAAGHTTTLTARDDGAIRLTSGRTKARLRMIRNDIGYPTIDVLDTSDMSEAQELGQKVGQVAWACESDKHGDLLAGVHIDGNFLYGTNRYLLAVTECKVPITEPVTVPLSSLGTILKAASDVRCKVGVLPSAHFARLQLALDDETTATTRVLEGEFPDVRKRIMRSDYAGRVTFLKRVFTETLSRMMVLARTERNPNLMVTVEGEEVTLDLEVETGRIQETFIAEAGEGLDRFSATLNPNYIGDAIASAATNEVRMDYGPGALQTLRISDEEGYECIIQPIKPTGGG